MFDLFGIKKRRQEREEARKKMLKDRKELAESRKSSINWFLNERSAAAYVRGQERYKKDREQCEKKNAVCPICGSKNRINKFVRTKGQLDGSLNGSSSGYGSLFGGYSHGSVSGKIHGELDTFQVNECRDCGNQWEVAKPEHTYVSDYSYDPWSIHSGDVGFLYRSIWNCLEEPEKLPKTSTSYITNQFKGAPREVLECLLYLYHTSYDGWGGDDYEEHYNDLYGIKICRDEYSPNFNDDAYVFTFTDEIWHLIQQIIGDVPVQA